MKYQNWCYALAAAVVLLVASIIFLGDKPLRDATTRTPQIITQTTPIPTGTAVVTIISTKGDSKTYYLESNLLEWSLTSKGNIAELKIGEYVFEINQYQTACVDDAIVPSSIKGKAVYSLGKLVCFTANSAK